ncbi:MAG TPA: YciI family protein [Polyangiaceae bacterium]
MLYAILCYDSEDVVESWTPDQDAAVIAKLEVVADKLAREGRLGPVARLMPTTTATTLRKGKEPIVLDGPFAETKEQLLGFFVVECASLAQAIDTAKELGRASSTTGSYEIRPLRALLRGALRS